MVEAMTNKQFGLICKGISHILANQEWIMRKLDPEDKHFYLTEDTNELSVKLENLQKHIIRQRMVTRNDTLGNS